MIDEEDLPPEAQEAIRKVRQLDMMATGKTARFGEYVEHQKVALGAEREELAATEEAFEALVLDKVAGAHMLGEMWAERERVLADTLAEKLRVKQRPAFGAAREVSSKGCDLAAARREAKANEWLLRLYEFHFPWLVDLREDEEQRSYLTGERLDGDAATSPDERTADPASGWLSAEEYGALPPRERNQRALDRYLMARKTPWQLGRDYERYVGYLREQDGWQVRYQGIFEGLDDLGRDLVCGRDGRIEVVQCKRWAQHKVIHEKHIFQLFGTVVAARIEHPGVPVEGTFVTTTALSERAQAFAEQLAIAVQERFPLDDYPRIKCNIARATGERIYHLPFDQQYDRAEIGAISGETWVSTVAEAEELGFRRAWRWHGSG